MDFVSDYIKRDDATLAEQQVDRSINAQDRGLADRGPVILRPDTNRQVDLLRYRC